MARGSKPGERRGGRQKGVPNRKNAEVIAEAKTTGLLPHEILLNVARAEYERSSKEGVSDDDKKDALDRAIDAAGKAAPFYAPKLASVEQKHSGSIGSQTKEQRDAAVAAAIRADG